MQTQDNAKTTRHIRVDYRFSELLAEDFGIDGVTVRQALIGEPKKAAIAVCGWAESTDGPAKALTNYAKKNRTGDYRRRVERFEMPSVDPTVDAWLSTAAV